MSKNKDAAITTPPPGTNYWVDKSNKSLSYPPLGCMGYHDWMLYIAGWNTRNTREVFMMDDSMTIMSQMCFEAVKIAQIIVVKGSVCNSQLADWGRIYNKLETV